MDREIWVNGTKLRTKPVEDHDNKFVITEDEAYFVPLVDAPQFVEILSAIFDLDDPSVFKDVEERLSDGRIILGRYSREIFIDSPLEPNEYVQKRLKEVFGEEGEWVK